MEVLPTSTKPLARWTLRVSARGTEHAARGL